MYSKLARGEFSQTRLFIGEEIGELGLVYYPSFYGFTLLGSDGNVKYLFLKTEPNRPSVLYL